MKEYEIKLLAYLIAEGHTKKPVLFCNTDPEIINDFKKSAKEFDHNIKITLQGNCNYRINYRQIKLKQLNKKLERDELGRIKKGNISIKEKTKIRKF